MKFKQTFSPLFSPLQENSMTYCNKTLILTALTASGLFGVNADAATINIDVGVSSQETADAGWNNLSSASPGSNPASLTDLIDSTGAATTVDLTYRGPCFQYRRWYSRVWGQL